MPFSRPTLATLVRRARTDLKSRLEGDPFLRRSFEYAIGAVLGGLSHGLHGHLAWLAKQVVPGPDSDDQTILRWATVFLRPPRKQATKATGPAVFTGNEASIIPAGTEVQLGDGTLYTVDEDGTIDGGNVTVDVTAQDPGEAGNAEEGATISLVSPIAGVDTDGQVGTGGLTGGTDIEPISGVFERLQLRLANPPRGGGEGDFEAWALETPGVNVARAFEYPKRNGPGTVGLAFTVEDGPIPTPTQLDEVESYVKSQMPTFMRSLDMIELTAKPLTATIKLKPNTVAVQDAVLAELEDLVDRDAKPEEPLLHSRIREAISTAEGEEDHNLVSPTDDVTAGTGELITFDAGEITFQEL